MWHLWFGSKGGLDKHIISVHEGKNHINVIHVTRTLHWKLLWRNTFPLFIKEFNLFNVNFAVKINNETPFARTYFISSWKHKKRSITIVTLERLFPNMNSSNLWIVVMCSISKRSITIVTLEWLFPNEKTL